MSDFDPEKYAWAKCVPEILVTDFQKSLRFYRMLGFDDMYQREEFAYLEYQGSQFMICQRDGSWETGEMTAPYGRGVNFQFSTDELDGLLERLRGANVPLYEPKHEKLRDIGGTEMRSMEFLVQDPDGYLLRFLQPIE